MLLFLKVAVTAVGAALAGINMDLQSVLSIVSSLRTCPAAAVGRTSRFEFFQCLVNFGELDQCYLHHLTV